MLGIVPARGGSKSIPGKNLAPLAGRPLLAYTAEAALTARLIDRVILTTDDDAIAEAGGKLGLEVPFMRPAALGDDTTPILPVIAHALDWCAEAGIPVRLVVLLQPTSPLRRAHHIDAAVALADAQGAETVVSVVVVPHNFSPDSVMVQDAGRLKPYLDGPMVLRRQEKRRYLARNGPAILAVRSEVIRRGALYGDPILGYEMDQRSSLDVDEPDDLWLAEQYIRRDHGAPAQ